MMNPIESKEKFPHLSKAPIVEAVIEFRVLPGDTWEPEKLKGALITALPDYSKKIEETKEFVYSLSMGGVSKKDDFGCVGYKLTSDDGYCIVQFNKQGFVFSRVKKYEKWNKFSEEARLLWKIYIKLLRPKKVKRIGVRFINHMLATKAPFNLSSYFINSPEEKQVEGWNLGRFFHQDLLVVTDTPYYVNLIKTVLPPPPNNEGGKVVIDIDVSINKDIDCDWVNLTEHLAKIHDIKNQTFFKNITEDKIKEFE